MTASIARFTLSRVRLFLQKKEKNYVRQISREVHKSHRVARLTSRARGPGQEPETNATAEMISSSDRSTRPPLGGMTPAWP